MKSANQREAPDSGAQRCPVCCSDKNHVTQFLGEYSMLLCEECGLEFANPLTCDVKMYEQAYEDNEFSRIGDYPKILELIKPHLLEENIGELITVLPPLYPFVLNWLKEHMAAGSRILDLGCGAGHFLILLRHAQFIPLGLDVATKPIITLREYGYAVAEGSVDNYPADWPSPDAIVALEVIEHLEAPLEFLRKIHGRFPDAPLLVSTPGFKRLSLRYGTREKWDYPPHHLTRWSPKALLVLLKSAGYENVEVLRPPVDVSEVSLGFLDRSARKLLRRNNEAQILRDGLGRTKRNHLINIARRVRLAYCRLVAFYFTARGNASNNMLGIGMS